MERSIPYWRKLASVCLVAILVGALSPAHGQDMWWEKDFGLGIQWSSGLSSKGLYNRESPLMPVDAGYAYLGVVSAEKLQSKSFYDVGTKFGSYEVFLSLWDQRLRFMFGQWKHSNALFRKESAPQQMAGSSSQWVFVWEGEFTDKVTYGGYALYFPISTSDEVGRFSIGFGAVFGHAKRSTVHYRVYQYLTSGSYKGYPTNEADYYVTFSAWAVRGTLSLRYDLPFLPVSIELSLAAQNHFLDTLQRWGEWEMRYGTPAGNFLASDKSFRDRAYFKEPGIFVLDISPSVSFTIPL
ncbi:MAG: hypothetical protein ONB25_12960 [candidate division KSB1 bacterium]|nr:hypothetical protein [candidate division KSB1 bacterium]